MLSRRRFLQSSAFGVAALSAPGILRAQSNGSVLRYIPQADLSILDPVVSTAFVSLVHGHLVFDTLYGMDISMTPQPQMVEGHTIENDGKKWTLKLRPGLTFHDGSKVLARDAVASINRWSQRDISGQALMSVVNELSAHSDDTIVFDLKQPFPMLPAMLGKAGNSMPAIMPERLALTDASQPVTEMVGSGPYKFVQEEWLPGSRVVYTRFEDYKPRSDKSSFNAGAKVAHISRIEWHVMPEAGTAASAMQAGEADLLENVSYDLMPLFEGASDVKLFRQPIPLHWIMRYNCLFKPFDNPAIRSALMQAIDQREVMSAVTGNFDYARTDVGFFNSASPMATPHEKEARDFDKIRENLKAAGYAGDEVLLLDPADQAPMHAAAIVCADSLTKAGVNVNLQAVDWGTVQQRRASRNDPAQGGWNILVTALSAFNAFDPVTNYALKGNGDKAWFGWPDMPDVEDLRNQWLFASSTDARKTIAAEIQTKAVAEAPHVPLGDAFLYGMARNGLEMAENPYTVFYNVKI